MRRRIVKYVRDEFGDLDLFIMSVLLVVLVAVLAVVTFISMFAWNPVATLIIWAAALTAAWWLTGIWLEARDYDWLNHLGDDDDDD